MRTRLLRPLVWLLAAFAVAATLQLLAQVQLRRELVREAVAELSPLVRGDTAYRWSLNDPRALVGRRVHGDCDYAFEADAIVLRRGSQRCEIGLSLRSPLDLRRFGTLRISTAGALPAFSLQLRERLSAPQHLAEVAAAPASVRVELRALAWTLDNGGTATVPARAAMLRLRFADLGQDLRLHAIALPPDDPAAWSLPSIAAATWLPSDQASTAIYPRVPLYVVDGPQRPELVLQVRDWLREQEPAAVVVFRADTGRVLAALASPPQPPVAGTLALAGSALLAVAALLLRRRPVADALWAMLALAVPLWLVVGLRVGDDLDGHTQLLIAAAGAYAIALGWRGAQPAWYWVGTRRAWLLSPAAPLVAAIATLLLGRLDVAAFPFSAVPGYLLWALAQQYLICAVFADRLRASGLPDAWTILSAAAAFSLLHAPNAALMLATFLGGLIWCTLWLRERSLLPLAASHAVAALLLTSGLPSQWLRSAEVSLRYYL